jgi:hypothetical protein
LRPGPWYYLTDMLVVFFLSPPAIPFSYKQVLTLAFSSS